MKLRPSLKQILFTTTQSRDFFSLDGLFWSVVLRLIGLAISFVTTTLAYGDGAEVLNDYRNQRMRLGSTQAPAPPQTQTVASNAATAPQLIADSRVKTILLVVDGLGVSTLQLALRQNLLPNLRALFLPTPASRISIGHASFPTLTFPNIAAILTAGAPTQSGILGNKLWRPGHDASDALSFESIRSRDALNRSLDGLTIFSQLAARRETSVSFDHFIYAGATARYDLDPEAGLAYQSGRYHEVDARLGQSAIQLLNGLQPDQWPRLTFLHFVSYDAFAHRFGPNSPEALTALRLLDAQFAQLREQSERAQNSRTPLQIVLTADHGFENIQATLDLKTAASVASDSLEILEQGRVAFLRWKKETPYLDRLKAYQVLKSIAGIDVVAWKDGSEIFVLTDEKSQNRQIRQIRLKLWPQICPYDPVYLGMGISEGTSGELQCLSQVDQVESRSSFGDQHPYLKTLLTQFFASAESPEAIVTARSGIAFAGGDHQSAHPERGHHGGLLPGEVLVPFLEYYSHSQSLVRSRHGSPLLSSASLLTPLKDPQSTNPLDKSRAKPKQRTLNQGEHAEMTPDMGRTPREGSTPTAQSTTGQRPGFFARLLDSGHEFVLNTSPAFLATELGSRPLLISPITANLDFEWRIYWNQRLSTRLGGGVRFPLLQSKLEVAPRALVGLGLSLGYRHQFWFDLGFQRRFIDPQTALYWPEFEVLVQSRWINLGIGDLVTVGGLGVVAPLSWNNGGNNGGISPATSAAPSSSGSSIGLSQRVEIAIQRYARERDTIAYGLGFVHRIQNVRHQSATIPQTGGTESPTDVGSDSQLLRDYEASIFLRYSLSP